MARDYDDRDRNMWERSRDEVRSWFGDEEAERRRRLDAHYDDEGDWRDEREFPPGRHHYPYGRSQRERAADAEYDRDWDLDQRERPGFEPYRSGAGMRPGQGWHERDSRSMYGGSHEGRRGGRQYEGDWDISGRRQRSRAQGGGRYSADPQGSFRYYSDYYNDEQGSHSYAGRGPRGYQRSEERIREDLNESLTWDPGIDASNIDVEVADGVVTLGGTVSSRSMKRRAEDLADSIRGVHDVHNRIRVNRDSHSQTDEPSRTARQDMQQRGSGTPTGQTQQDSGRTGTTESGQQGGKFGS